MKGTTGCFLSFSKKQLKRIKRLMAMIMLVVTVFSVVSVHVATAFAAEEVLISAAEEKVVEVKELESDVVEKESEPAPEKQIAVEEKEAVTEVEKEQEQASVLAQEEIAESVEPEITIPADDVETKSIIEADTDNEKNNPETITQPVSSGEEYSLPSPEVSVSPLNSASSTPTITDSAPDSFAASSVDTMNELIVNNVSDDGDIFAPDSPIVLTTLGALSATNINIDGTAEIGSIVVITGGAQESSTMAMDGTYSINVALNENMLNILSIVAIDAAGNRSIPTLVEIISDTTAPVITNFTISQPFISPNNSVGIKDSSVVDITLSETASLYININDQSGNYIKNIYSSFKNPTQNVILWDGADEAGLLVPDGVYIISVQSVDQAGNWMGDESKTITVDNIAPEINIEGSNSLDVVYGLTYSEGVSVNDASALIIGGDTISVSSPVGTYNLTYDATDLAGNSAVQMKRTINVIPRNIMVAIDAKTKVYGSDDPEYTYQIVGDSFLVSSDSFVGMPERAAGENVGIYAISKGTLSLNDNYVLTVTGNNLNILKANLNVIADNKNINFGSKKPEFTFALAGFANGDALTLIKVLPSCSVSAHRPRAGTYPIICSGGADDNYNFNYIQGLLSVNLLGHQIVPDGQGIVTVDATKKEVVVTDPLQEVTLNVGSIITDSTINVSDLIFEGVGILPRIKINSNLAGVSIASSTKVTSSNPAWNGIISAPMAANITLPQILGESVILGSAVQIGFAEDNLSFDKGVRILLPDQAEMRVGYTRGVSPFTEITTVCAFDDQQWADNNLGVDGDCKIDVGDDLIIWSKHFTTFASFESSLIWSDSDLDEDDEVYEYYYYNYEDNNEDDEDKDDKDDNDNDNDKREDYSKKPLLVSAILQSDENRTQNGKDSGSKSDAGSDGQGIISEVKAETNENIIRDAEKKSFNIWYYSLIVLALAYLARRWYMKRKI